MCHSVSLAVFIVILQINTHLAATPPLTDKPVLLSSYIPACMQVLAHVTELMKYDLRPQSATTVSPGHHPTSTTTQSPTPPHRPGIYSPQKPLGQAGYFSSNKGFSYRDYVIQIQQPSGLNYFSRYPDGQRNLDAQDNIPVDFYLYFGKSYTDLLRLANSGDQETNGLNNDIDVQVQEFSKSFDDDTKFRLQLLRQKKVPPTRAYVTLLSLYDMMNKESKKLSLNKYQGYTEEVLQDLIETSISTSVYQLRTVLNKAIDHNDTKDPNILKKIKQITNDIDDHDSYINLALKYIPPLAFVP